MANEITAYFGITVLKGNLNRRIDPVTVSADLAGSRVIQNVQIVASSAHEAIVVGDLASAGFAMFKNLDTTNFVSIGVEVSATFYAFIKLLPGESALVRLNALTIFAQANTAPVNLDCFLSEA
jgi:hypothetical protein